MAARKLGASWWADFRFNFRRYRKRAPLNTERGARDYEMYLRGELAKHGSLEHLKPQPPAPRPVTFGEFAERWMRDYVAIRNRPSEQSTKMYILRAHLLPRFGERALDVVTAGDVHAFVADQRRAGLAAKTVNNQLCVLRKMLRTAEEWGLLARVPKIADLPSRLPPFRSSTLEDAAAIAELCEPTFARMVTVAVNTGLRYGELAALEWEDHDPVRRELLVQRSYVNGVVGPPKNGRTRRVPLNADALRAVTQQPRTSSPLIFHRNDRYIPHDAARLRLRRACQALGLAPIGWHALRHTFASELSRRGVSLQFVRDILGHSTINMTLRYAHLAPESLAAAVSTLDGAVPPAVITEDFGQQAVQVDETEAPGYAPSVATHEKTGLWPVPSMVQRLGFEPRTLGLRGLCSTS